MCQVLREKKKICNTPRGHRNMDYPLFPLKHTPAFNKYLSLL